jgi:hypothetical protein
MGADPIGALPAGQGNVERAKAMDQSLHWSDEAMDRPSNFIPPLRVATVELEWASIVLVQVRSCHKSQMRTSEPNR